MAEERPALSTGVSRDERFDRFLLDMDWMRRSPGGTMEKSASLLLNEDATIRDAYAVHAHDPTARDPLSKLSPAPSLVIAVLIYERAHPKQKPMTAAKITRLCEETGASLAFVLGLGVQVGELVRIGSPEHRAINAPDDWIEAAPNWSEKHDDPAPRRPCARSSPRWPSPSPRSAAAAMDDLVTRASEPHAARPYHR